MVVEEKKTFAKGFGLNLLILRSAAGILLRPWIYPTHLKANILLLIEFGGGRNY